MEDKGNNIRAIFTVERLTEGWDVLNLFDIVRLYSGQNAGGSTKKVPEATIKEKQLIGRGVRYFPFTYGDKTKSKRKFDNDWKNELRVLEELYYYTYDEESRYICHLKKELKKDGYISDGKVIKAFSLKQEFQKSDFYKNTKIWYNERKENPNRKKTTLEDIKKDFSMSYKLKSLGFNEEEIVPDNSEDMQKLNLKEDGLRVIFLKFKEIEKHIFHKAINVKAKQENSLCQFDRLKKELNIKSMEDLRNDIFLGDLNMTIKANKIMKFEDLSGENKLKITMKFLDIPIANDFSYIY